MATIIWGFCWRICRKWKNKEKERSIILLKILIFRRLCSDDIQCLPTTRPPPGTGGRYQPSNHVLLYVIGVMFLVCVCLIYEWSWSLMEYVISGWFCCRYSVDCGGTASSWHPASPSGGSNDDWIFQHRHQVDQVITEILLRCGQLMPCSDMSEGKTCGCRCCMNHKHLSDVPTQEWKRPTWNWQPNLNAKFTTLEVRYVQSLCGSGICSWGLAHKNTGILD